MIKNITQRAESIRDQLIKNKNIISDTNPIDANFNAIPPFIGKEAIKLFIIGQDPTIRNRDSRAKINVTLNLDKPNALRNYINQICTYLNLNIENVYATNLFKYSYTKPPADTKSVLENHLEPNLNLLKEELDCYPNIPVITLGQPLLQLLTDKKNFVRRYWDYDEVKKITNSEFKACINNKLNRTFFPFPHQPSLRKTFYKDNLALYCEYVKDCMN